MAQWTDEPGVVTLPDGRRVRGSALRRPRGEVPDPEFAVYCIGKTPSPQAWEHVWIPWGDFGLPSDRDGALDALRRAHAESSHVRVEVSCGGGIGRTGTALAALAVLSGIPSRDAVSWVRANYHRRAVETPWQRRWVSGLDARL